jgi:hypothetical protein
MTFATNELKNIYLKFIIIYSFYSILKIIVCKITILIQEIYSNTLVLKTIIFFYNISKWTNKNKDDKKYGKKIESFCTIGYQFELII